MSEETLYDPSAHKADEVVKYLAKADSHERERVQAAEAQGQNRKTITEWTPTPGEVAPDADGYTRVPVEEPYRAGGALPV